MYSESLTLRLSGTVTIVVECIEVVAAGTVRAKVVAEDTMIEVVIPPMVTWVEIPSVLMSVMISETSRTAVVA